MGAQGSEEAAWEAILEMQMNLECKRKHILACSSHLINIEQMNYYASPASCLVIIEVTGNQPKDKFNPTSSFYGVKQVKARNIKWFARSHISSEGLCWG